MFLLLLWINLMHPCKIKVLFFQKRKQTNHEIIFNFLQYIILLIEMTFKLPHCICSTLTLCLGKWKSFHAEEGHRTLCSEVINNYRHFTKGQTGSLDSFQRAFSKHQSRSLRWQLQVLDSYPMHSQQHASADNSGKMTN